MLAALPAPVQLLLGALVLQLLLAGGSVGLVAAREGLPPALTALILLIVLGTGLGLYAGLAAWLVLRRSAVAWSLLLAFNLPASLSGTGSGVLLTLLSAGSALLVVGLLVAPPVLRFAWAGTRRARPSRPDLRRPD